MLDQLIEFLSTLKWKYSDQNPPGMVTFPVTGQNGIYHCFADMREDSNLFIFISYAGYHCPQDKQSIIIELFNKINTNLPFGDFELDVDSGQMKFRTSQFIFDKETAKKIFETVIFRNINVMDFSFHYFLELIHDKTVINEVFDNLFHSAQIESSTNEQIEK